MKVTEINLYEGLNIKSSQNRGILTVYEPDLSVEISLERQRPAMLVIPGGGYQIVSFREAEPICLKYLQLGYICFCLNYSVVPFDFDYQPLIEGALAMVYIRKNMAKYHINNVYAIGFSAGGHLCGFLGNAFDDYLFDPYFTQEEKKLIRPDGVVLSYAVLTSQKSHAGTIDSISINEEDTKIHMNIVERINNNSSPAYLWCTADDGAVPCHNSIDAANKYALYGVPFSLHVYPHGQHGLSTADLLSYKEFNFETSTFLTNWVEESNEFFKFTGLKIEG